MSAPQPWSDAAVLARTTARVLSLGGWIAAFALVLTLAALAAVATSAALAPGWLTAVAVGAIAFYYALRARIDERLFDDLASALACGVSEADALRVLDAALVELRVDTQRSSRRSLAERAQASMRLLRRASILTIAELALSAALWSWDPSR